MGTNSSSSNPPPRQLTLPECSQAKTRRQSGKPLRRRREKPTLVIPDMPKEICDVLKRLAKRDKLTYTQLCRIILTDYAHRALNPRRRP